MNTREYLEKWLENNPAQVDQILERSPLKQFFDKSSTGDRVVRWDAKAPSKDLPEDENPNGTTPIIKAIKIESYERSFFAKHRP